MKLIVAEKGKIAEKIALAVGASRDGSVWKSKDYVITHCQGHLCELYMPEDYSDNWKRWSKDTLPLIPERFQYKVIEQTKGLYQTVERWLQDRSIDSVVNACDPEREGEAIFRTVYNMARCKKPVERLWVESMEPDALRKGLSCMRPMSDYDNLAASAFARSEADWLVGINFTRTFSLSLVKKAGVPIRLGRVQTPTVQMVVQRELEICNFKPVPYWVVSVDHGDIVSTKRLNTAAEADAVVRDCAKPGATAIVREFQKENNTSAAPHLYCLSDLQSDCNKRFGLSAATVLDTLQELYDDDGYASYPRTSSIYITDAEVPVANSILKVMDGGFLPPELICYSGVSKLVNTNEVEGHPAILPTVSGVNALLNDKITDRNKKIIMTMLCLRLAAAVAPKKVWNSIKAVVDIEGHEFEAVGTELVDPGWSAIVNLIPSMLGGENDGNTRTRVIPELVVGSNLDVLSVKSDARKTKPPSRYTEGTLLAAMKNCGQKIENDEQRRAMRDKGLGTEATRTEVLRKIIISDDSPFGFITRGKDGKDTKHLYPTSMAMALMALLPLQIKDPAMTGSWEQKLMEIVRGTDSKELFLDEIRSFVDDVVRKELWGNMHTAEELDALNSALDADADAEDGIRCPVCKEGTMQLYTRRKDRDGNALPKKMQTSFWGCSNKDCRFSVNQTVCKYKLTELDIESLCKSGRTRMIDKFYSDKKERYFSAALVLALDSVGNPTGKLDWSFEATPSEQAASALGVCPVCGNDIVAFRWRRPTGEMVSGYRCSNRNCTLAWLTDTYFSRKMKKSEWQRLIKHGETTFLEGFMSKSGKEFCAKVMLEKRLDNTYTGKLSFLFDEKLRQKKPTGKG